MKQILFVDKDKKYYELLKISLKTAMPNVNLLYASNSWEGIVAFSSNNSEIDLVIANLQIKPINGIEFIKYLKEMDLLLQTIILTSREDWDNELLSLELGIDRYLNKNIGIKLLVKYIENSLNNSKKKEQNVYMLKKEKITLNEDTREVYKGGQRIDLTNKEFNILKILLENKSSLVTRETMVDNVWEKTVGVNNRVVDVHIKSIRRKLKTKAIIAVYGYGYRWSE